MRVALISPRGAERNQQNSVLNEIYRKLQNVVSFIEIDDIEFIPNLGLLSIAAYFPRDWEVEYVEEDREGEPGRRVVPEVVADLGDDVCACVACARGDGLQELPVVFADGAGHSTTIDQ